MEEIVAKKYLVLANELNERQRRLWAASEALRLGHGGIAVVAKATGMSGTTMIHASDGFIPSDKATDTEGIEEELRLFYVALTRAAKRLYIWAFAGK